MEKNYRLTYDFGSGSVKAALVDEAHQLVGVENAPYPTYFPHNGWAEQKPADHWKAMCRATRALLVRTGAAPEAIVGIALSHTATSVIFTDADGVPLTDCVMWMDGRAGREADAINARLGEARYTGKNVIAKLAWFLRHQPETVGRAAYMLDVAACLLHRMTGRFVYEFTGARATCLVDLQTRSWDPAQFDLIGFPRRLVPETIIGSTEQAGVLTAQAARQMGLVPGIPVFGGCSDHATAILGTASVRPGDAHLYIGTSAWLAVVTGGDAPHPGRMPSPVPGMRYHFYDTDAGGTCLDQLAALYYPDAADAFEQIGQDILALQRAEDTEDILFLPFLAGASAPLNDLNVRASLLNLKRSTRRAHIARAVMEGVCLNLRWMCELHAQQTGTPIRALRGIGGGMCSPVFVQMLADVIGVPVTPMESPRFAGNLGLSLCIDLGRGRYRDFSALSAVVQPGIGRHPRPETRARYDRLYGIYRAAYQALTPVYQQLNGSKENER